MSVKAKIRIGPLDNVGGIVSELGKVYRQARRGQLDTQDATRLAFILREIRIALESSDIEKRLEVLEGDNPAPHLRRIA